MLHRVVSDALQTGGVREIAAERGALRIDKGAGDEVQIQALSATGKPLFSYSLTRSSCVLQGPLNAEEFRARYGPEAEVLRGMRKTISRVVPQQGQEFDLLRERMPSAPVGGEAPSIGTPERARFDLVRKLDEALSDVGGKKLERRGFLVGGRVYDLYRSARDPYEFTMEVGSVDGLRDSLIGARVVASLGKAAYHNADDRGVTGTEREAIETITEWLGRVGLRAK